MSLHTTIRGHGWLARGGAVISSLVGFSLAVSAPVEEGPSFDAAARFAKVQAAIERSNAPQLAGEAAVQQLIDGHREAIEACTSHACFGRAVNKLIDDIGLSHFAYYTDDDWSYWHLRSYFVDRGSAGSHVEHVGIIPELIDDRWFVRGLLEGSPAAGKGVEVGDELLSVDGMAFSPIGVFRGTAGRKVTLRLRRSPGQEYEIRVTPKKESLYDAMQRAVRKSISVVGHGGHRLAYLHGWTLLGDGREYARLLKLQDDVDGLLLDYRDGFGGQWHVAERFLMGPTGGVPSRLGGTWTKPVVILTDTGTRSAKEIVVYRVKKAGRAPLVGEPTPGHVIAVGGIVQIEDDGLLMLPGFAFDLEGRPVVPDFLIERDIRYCGGADPQMDFARDLLGQLIDRERRGLGGSWDEAVMSMPNVASTP